MSLSKPMIMERPGSVPLLTEKPGKPFVLLALEGYDLRDPKLSINPDGKLMLHMGGSVYKNGELLRMQNHVAFLDSSGTFSKLQALEYSPELKSDRNWL